MMVRFIHTADLHIDSPLKSLRQIEGAPVGPLLDATRNALVRIVDAALQRQVHFVIIAGDLFDGPWSDMQTGAWTARQFRRLEAAGIPVYLLQGNHDAESRVERSTAWPPNVHFFPVQEPSTFILDTCPVALHGQGFAHREVMDNLATNYPPPRKNHINIGVLHTCLGGDPQHGGYAPCSVQDLVDRKYHYWALGHIHRRQVVHQEPYIVFPGNTQGRSIRETGDKGCYIVEMDGDQVTQFEFLATDTIRWHPVHVKLEADDDCAMLLDRLRAQLLQQHADAPEEIGLAARIIVTGACTAHRQLAEFAEADRVEGEIRSIANTLPGNVWIEKIQLDTSPPTDLHRLRERRDLLGQLFRDFSAVGEDDDALVELSSALQALAKTAAVNLHDAGVGMTTPEQIRTWLSTAENLLATQLTETEA